ncbi:MAG: 16S rRNA (guanine(527)-N(7))-methyltransferase RsmG [Eubacteriales bacterium]|nr:16S rRNA (guanine(527)-N(7))-methyltransferase RsmG [Eubacteriales bacterium]
MSRAEETALFQARLDALGVACDPRTAQRLARYREMLWEWNQRMNLTGDASLEATLDKHFMDSLAPLTLPGLWPQGTNLVDVGSGAGFPGLPLAIARLDMDVFLIEAQQKKIGFLDAVIAELRLTNVSTLHARSEDAAWDTGLRERFDVAAARAVAAAPVLMELLLPFVRTGGKALCYKGPSAQEEIGAGNRAAMLLGGGVLECYPVAVPGQPDWQHCLLVSQKRRPTPAAYPRKAGMPAKAPLGGETTQI